VLAVRTLRGLVVAAGEDTRWALRLLARSPASTTLAIGVLAFGTGVNTAVFSLLKDAWFDRLPVARPDELVQVILESKDARMSNLPYPESARWLHTVHAFEGVFFYRDAQVNLRDRDWSRPARGRFVSGTYYAILGVAPAAGRLLQAADDRPSAMPAAVISHELWARQYAHDPAVVGRTVHLSGRPFTIVGVTPRPFFGVDRLWVPEITIPLGLDRGQAQALARLRPGIPVGHAGHEVTDGLRRLLEAGEMEPARWPTRGPPMGARLDSAAAGTWGVRLRLLEPLRVLSALTLLVLVMTCLNLSSLVRARAAARRKEFGVRLALGADRGRLMRQMLVEGVTLGAIGGLASLLVAFALHRLLVVLLPVQPGAALGFRLDGWMLVFNTAVTAVSGIVVGLGTAVRTSRLAPTAVLAGAADRPEGCGRVRFRTSLAAQIATALVLSVAAMTFARRLVDLLDVDPGFDRAKILLATIDPEECQLTPPGMVRLSEELAARVRSLPGVEAAGLALKEVSGMRGSVKAMWVEGHEYSPDESRMMGFGAVSPGFFPATGIPLFSGRDVSAHDGRGTAPVVLVNLALAERYFPGRSPLGKRLGDGPGPAAGGRSYEIVGVVGSARHAGLRRAPPPMVFHPLPQAAEVRPFVLHVRTRGRPGALAGAVRETVRATDPRLVVSSLRTIGEETSAELRQERMLAALSTLFAVLGLGLCCVGLYGVTADSVERRTREIGIRAALGATGRGIMTLMLRETLPTVVGGLAIGALAARICAPLARGFLFGLAAPGLGSTAVAAAAFASAAAAAALVPARRASRIDAAVALRSD
jgi:predicted permease